MPEGSAMGTAVIIGGGTGIGHASALALARQNHRIVVGDLDGAAAERTAREIGPNACGVAVDARDREALERLAAEADAVLPIRTWVNSAGVGALVAIEDMTPGDYERVRSVNMDGTLWGCAAAARHMKRHGGGSIVNISSNAADQPMSKLSVYAMTKAAVNMLTRSLALELGPSGIRVNAVAPGFILTPLTMPEHLGEAEREKIRAANAARSPLGMVGEPRDVADAVAYLTSDAARYITGHIMRVNGGASMP